MLSAVFILISCNVSERQCFMIHPDTTIRLVDPVIGNGVYATKAIPKGTIIVVKDSFDRVIRRQDFLSAKEPLQGMVENYVYHDKNGNLVLSWDHAKYMNHNCDPNTMMTDYDLEVVVRDIAIGEQITTEYGLLNLQEEYDIHCACANCRKRLRLTDIDQFATLWDEKILESLLRVESVAQPLWDLVDDETRKEFRELREVPKKYRSVKNLKWRCE